MKPRRVILTLEVVTDVSLSRLRVALYYEVGILKPGGFDLIEVVQAQANVVALRKERTKKRP